MRYKLKMGWMGINQWTGVELSLRVALPTSALCITVYLNPWAWGLALSISDEGQFFVQVAGLCISVFDRPEKPT